MTKLAAVSTENLAAAAKTSEEWDSFLRQKYDPASVAEEVPKPKDAFRDYESALTEQPKVSQFYAENHEKQTLSFVLSQKAKYASLDKLTMGIWEAMEKLNALVDDSDPDTSLTQIEHCLQAAEAARRDGQPRWMVLTCLIHDLGKVLFFLGEPQWAVVGDTFPVGCRWSDKIVYPDFFARNLDREKERLQTPLGIYEEHCGLDRVHMSYGHDEYLATVVKGYLPEEAVYIIRYHSFYSAHREGEYRHLMDERDERLMEWVRKFNPYDLYSKSDDAPKIEDLKPYYQELIAEYFPEKIKW
ncbi:inositol oxygenase [Jimgerdemannia flammicorona]|uniref:Inositol oxygenase n=2 Tax=Jimgerdemannia flammicorona TaxID=994334 RepID=A0A433D044_9FUNG|nr:inositol oxygenase [Jimgerdemannia flammicorona]RUS25438.1 inositol oxygenase [Jimgerdemannia flammicorona]